MVNACNKRRARDNGQGRKGKWRIQWNFVWMSYECNSEKGWNVKTEFRFSELHLKFTIKWNLSFFVQDNWLLSQGNGAKFRERILLIENLWLTLNGGWGRVSRKCLSRQHSTARSTDNSYSTQNAFSSSTVSTLLRPWVKSCIELYLWFTLVTRWMTSHVFFHWLVFSGAK